MNIGALIVKQQQILLKKEYMKVLNEIYSNE